MFFGQLARGSLLWLAEVSQRSMGRLRLVLRIHNVLLRYRPRGRRPGLEIGLEPPAAFRSLIVARVSNSESSNVFHFLAVGEQLSALCWGWTPPPGGWPPEGRLPKGTPSTFIIVSTAKIYLSQNPEGTLVPSIGAARSSPKKCRPLERNSA